MKLIGTLLIALTLISCGDYSASNTESKAGEAKIPARPENQEIDKYKIKGFALVELDFGIEEFYIYSESDFSSKKIASLSFSSGKVIASDKPNLFPLPIFQNNQKAYFQVIEKKNEFMEIVLDEVMGTTAWLAPTSGLRSLSWPVFFLEQDNLHPIESNGYKLSKDFEADEISDVSPECYRAIQSTADWIFLMKKENCKESTPKMLYLRWHDGDERIIDFSFKD